MNLKLFTILRISGLPFLFREFIQKRRVSILMFHDIDVEAADQAFRYLVKHYNLIDLERFIQAHKNKTLKDLPEKSLIITFDDGHEGNFKLLPIFKKYNIPVTIFLCSEIINTKRMYWFKFPDILNEVQTLKTLSNEDRLSMMKLKGFDQKKEYENNQAMTKEQLIEMSEIVNLQSHTKFHPCLTKCSDSEAKSEIMDSKSKLEIDYGFKIYAFAYPNGDYSKREMNYAEQVGYECAVTVDPGFNTSKTDLYALKRLSVNDTKNIDELIVKSSGLWAFFKSLV